MHNKNQVKYGVGVVRYLVSRSTKRGQQYVTPNPFHPAKMPEIIKLYYRCSDFIMIYQTLIRTHNIIPI